MGSRAQYAIGDPVAMGTFQRTPPAPRLAVARYPYGGFWRSIASLLGAGRNPEPNRPAHC